MLLNIIGFAQSTKIDSLLAVLKTNNHNDSLKVVKLTNVFREYKKLDNIPKIKEYSDKAIALAKTLPQTTSLTNVYFKLGICYHGCTMYVDAINSYNEGIIVANERNDYFTAANFYLNLSALYQEIPDYNKALAAADSAVILYTKANALDNISGCYMNISTIYTDLKNPVKAISYIDKALPVFLKENSGINYGTALAYQSKAENYKIATATELKELGLSPLQRDKECLNYLVKALNVAIKVGEGANTLIPTLHNDIGKTYEAMGNKVLALQYYNSALQEFATNSEDQNTLADIYYSFGCFYVSNNNYDSSIRYLNQSLQVAKEYSLLLLQQQALLKLSQVYEAKGDYKNAHIYYKQYDIVTENILTTEKEKELTRKQLQFDFAVKEKEYKLVAEVDSQKLKQQQQQINFDKKIKIFFALALLMLAAIAGLIYRDRAKTKKLNAIINQQKESLEQLGVVKDKIFSVVSHDMRAPVNALMSFINILENGNLPPEKLNLYAKDLKQSLSSTSSLMNNMLNWAASQMQGFTVVKEKVNLVELVNEITKSLEHHWQAKSLVIKNEIPPTTLVTDANMLAAIVRNLLSNAFKFSYTNTAVNILLEQENSFYEIKITDSGTGMEQKQIDAFNSTNQEQVESKRGTQNEKGTGLGLMLCKTFAQQLGGNITAQKNEIGTTFILQLPVTSH